MKFQAIESEKNGKISVKSYPQSVLNLNSVGKYAREIRMPGTSAQT